VTYRIPSTREIKPALYAEKTQRAYCFVFDYPEVVVVSLASLHYRARAEKAGRLFENDAVHNIQVLLETLFVSAGGIEAIPLLLQSCCVDNHIPPGCAPMEVLTQAVDHSQCCGNDRGRDRESNAYFLALEK